MHETLPISVENFWSFLDMRTIFFSMVVTNLVCTLVMILLWRLNYKRLDGIYLWVADFFLQSVTVFLIVLRGQIPDWISIDLANTLSIVGIYLGYMSLEKFFHIKTAQWYNHLILLIFPILFTWATFVHPDLSVRNLLISLFSFYFCFLCAWLLFFRIKPRFRQMSRLIGIVFFLFCVVDLIRILHFFLSPHLQVNYMDAGFFDAAVILLYEILMIVLSFGLALLFNRTLLNNIAVQEEKFSKAFYTSPYGIILTRMHDSKILEINATFRSMTGYEPQDMVGKTALTLHFWDNPADRSFVLNELEQQREVRGLEFVFRKKNGDRFIGIFSAQVITIDEVPCLMSSINDISNRKKAEDELKESELKFRSLFTRMSEGFALHEVIYDAKHTPVDYRILEVNQAFEKLVGIQAETAKGGLATAVYGLEEAPFLDVYADVAESGNPQSFRSYFAPKERYYDILVFSPSKGSFATIFSDITEQQKAEEALMNNEVHLRNLNATKDKFFSIIAHDLKSPFNSILGFSKLLAESVHTKDYEHVVQYANIIEKSTQRTMDLLMNLLEWSRSQTGKLEYLPEYLEVSSVLDEVLELFEQGLLQKSITVQLEQLPLTTVYADKVLTSTILRNLLSNAIKFTNPGGEIHVSAMPVDGMLEFCVRDNGVGITKEDVKKLFRIEDSYTRKGTLNEQGTGLGLLLCKEFVEKQGGKIRVVSEPGKGSAFYFTLPVNL